MGKLTLSATPEVIRQARLLSQRRRTTISGLFARFITIQSALAEDEREESERRLAALPLCRQALEIGRRMGGGDFDAKAVLSEAICARYLKEEK